MFGVPAKLPAGYDGLPRALQLAAASAAGAQPGLHSWGDAAGRALHQDPGRRWVNRDVVWLKLNERYEEITPVRNPPAVTR